MAGCCLCSLLTWTLVIAVVWVAAAFIVNKLKPRKKDALCIILGSGGHTGEMLYMMLRHKKGFSQYKKIYCVLGDNDTLSIGKMKSFCAKNKVTASSHADGLGFRKSGRVPDCAKTKKERRRHQG